MSKLTRGSLRILRERVPSAQRPRARWRAIVRLVAARQGWSNTDAFFLSRYRDTSLFEALAMGPTPFLQMVLSNAH